MSEDIIQTNPPDAFARLGKVLTIYATTRHLAPEKALLRQGRNVSIKLYQTFLATAAGAGSITAATQARGWRLGREGGADAGISYTAIQRTRKRMGGLKSILAVVTEADGRISVRGVRSAKRGGRRISGGRRGLNGRAVAGTDSTLREAGDVRLNFRAVATIEEINLREAGRRFLAISWLQRNWQKLSQKDATAAGADFKLVNVNPRSRLNLLGEADLSRSGPVSNAVSTLRLSSFVPGVKEVGERRGLFAQAMDAVSDDMAEYLVQLEADELSQKLAAASR